MTAGSFCQYAVIGPDPDNVLADNIRTLNARLASPSPSAHFQRFEFVQTHGLFGTRVDVAAIFDRGGPLLVDSFAVRSGGTIEPYYSTDNKVAILSAPINPGVRDSARTGIFVFNAGDRLTRREHYLDCFGSQTTTARLAIRNLNWTVAQRRITFDIATNCGTIQANSDSYLELSHRSYADVSAGYLEYGDVVYITLDEDFYLTGVGSRGADAAAHSDAQSLQDSDADLRDCLVRNGVRAGQENGAPRGEFFQICRSLAVVRSNAVGSAYALQRDGSYRTAQYFSCDHLRDIVIARNHRAVMFACEKDNTRYDADSAREIFVGRDLHLTVATDNGRRTELTFQCDCQGGVRLSALDFRDGALFFELSTNVRVIRISGHSVRLLSGDAAMPDIDPPYPHGAFRMALTDEMSFAALTRVR